MEHSMESAAPRPLVHAVPIGNAPRIPEGMGAAMRPRSTFDRPSTLPYIDARPQMAAERAASFTRPTESARFAPRTSMDDAREFVTRREVTEVLNKLDRTIGEVGQAAVEEEGDRDISAFVALGIVAGIVALAVSS